MASPGGVHGGCCVPAGRRDFGLIRRPVAATALARGAYRDAVTRRDELRASEGRLRDFAGLASDWFWEQDADLRFKEVIIGSPVGEGNDHLRIGDRRWEINDTSVSLPDGEKHAQQVLAHQRFDDFRYDRVGLDGKLYHISISGLPLHDGSGAFTGYRGIGRDVTAEVAAAGELYAAKIRAEQAETLLRDAVDSMSEGFVIYDSQDNFVLCNDAYRQLYRSTASQIMPGMPYRNFVRNNMELGQYSDAADERRNGSSTSCVFTWPPTRRSKSSFSAVNGF